MAWSECGCDACPMGDRCGDGPTLGGVVEPPDGGVGDNTGVASGAAGAAGADAGGEAGVTANAGGVAAAAARAAARADSSSAIRARAAARSASRTLPRPVPAPDAPWPPRVSPSDSDAAPPRSLPSLNSVAQTAASLWQMLASARPPGTRAVPPPRSASHSDRSYVGAANVVADLKRRDRVPAAGGALAPGGGTAGGETTATASAPQQSPWSTVGSGDGATGVRTGASVASVTAKATVRIASGGPVEAAVPVKATAAAVGKVGAAPTGAVGGAGGGAGAAVAVGTADADKPTIDCGGSGGAASVAKCRGA